MNNQIITILVLLLCVVASFETIRQLGTPKRASYMLGTGILWVLFYVLTTGVL